MISSSPSNTSSCLWVPEPTSLALAQKMAQRRYGHCPAWRLKQPNGRASSSVKSLGQFFFGSISCNLSHRGGFGFSTPRPTLLATWAPSWTSEMSITFVIFVNIDSNTPLSLRTNLLNVNNRSSSVECPDESVKPHHCLSCWAWIISSYFVHGQAVLHFNFGFVKRRACEEKQFTSLPHWSQSHFCYRKPPFEPS